MADMKLKNKHLMELISKDSYLNEQMSNIEGGRDCCYTMPYIEWCRNVRPQVDPNKTKDKDSDSGSKSYVVS